MQKKGIGLMTLIALVVSSSIGAGIFALSSDVATVAAPGAVMIAWLIVGIGILALALSFSNLVIKRPDLEGIFAYAQAGFGDFAGFLSGWGYWLSAWLGNVAFATVLVSSLGYFYPIFKTGHNIPSIILASVIAWSLTYFVTRGVESAAVLNAIVAICKLIPLFVFIILAIILFKVNMFTKTFWGNVGTNFSAIDVLTQVKGCIMVMMWVFVGIEGATMMSSRAKNKRDTSTATIIGVFGLLVIYSVVSLLPYGYLSRTELAGLPRPALVYLFQHMIGPIGGAIISIGLVISILGAWLSWTMLPAETVMLMSKDQLLPKQLAKVNRFNAPHIALLTTQILIQLFLFTLLFTSKAYEFAYSLCTAAIVITYSFVAAYQIKFSWINRRTTKNAWFQVAVGVIALVFEIVGIILAGAQFLLLAMIAYIPGLYFYVQAQKQKNPAYQMQTKEKVISILIIILGLIGLLLLILGKIKLG